MIVVQLVKQNCTRQHLHGSVNRYCRAMKTKGMVFRYTWVYSKEDTMARTGRPMVTS